MATRITDLRNGEGAYAALDDRMLVLDFQAGHPEAFVEIHGRYGGLVRHVCSRYLPNAADADEAFQETMIRVFQGLYRFNGQYALQPWVARIATNISLDIIRGRARRPTVDERSIEEHDREDPGEKPDEAVERLVQRDLILNVLADMPDTHRRALVLREVEGMSHKEIGEHLEITPSQAKALIHRAKGTFRRRWLHAISERGGVMAFALAPAMWAMRAIGGARRVADRVAQATITTDVVSNAASSASAAPTATFTAERLVAAATVTVLIAGGVTVGAATFGRNGSDRDRSVERVQAAPSLVPQAAPDASPRSPAAGPSEPRGRNGRGLTSAFTDSTEDTAPEASPTADPSPPAEPSADPPPSESPSPEPVVPVAPAWDFGFSSSTRSVEECGCGPETELTASSVDISPEGTTAFSFDVNGGAMDAQGDVAWGFELSASGSTSGADGSVSYRFTLYSIVGALQYDGIGVLAETTPGHDGDSITYRFSGTFALISDDGKGAPSGLPSLGEASLTFSVWTPDSSIYGGSMALYDAL